MPDEIEISEAYGVTFGSTFYDASKNRCLENSFKLLKVNPSYGSELYCLCKCRIPDDHMAAFGTNVDVSDTTASLPEWAFC